MRVVRHKVAFGDFRNDSHSPNMGGTVGRGLFYFIFAALVLTNILTLVGFLMAPDISRLVSGQNERIFAAYEDRIAQLRIEVDRLYSRQYAQSGNLNLQLIELQQQQAALSEIHPFVKALAAKAQELGIDNIAGIASNGSHQATPPEIAEPDIHDLIITGSINPTNDSKQIQIDRLEFSINALTNESHLALKTLSNAADSSAEVIFSELKKIGIASTSANYDETASGGQFIQYDGNDDRPSLVDEANAVAKSFDRFGLARRAIRSAPVLMPLQSKFRLSSAYGTRKDPFGRQKAFHSGNDFAACSIFRTSCAASSYCVSTESGNATSTCSFPRR